MSFKNANNFIVHGNINAVDNSSHRYSATLKDLLNAACPAASHQSDERDDPPPKCHPDTRKKIIEDIMEWIDSPDTDEPIMWLSGSAGVGKSAIAQTIADRCYDEDKLLSSFFFSRTDTGSGRDDGRKLIPTIAYNLATEVPAAKELIIAELERDPAIFQHSMQVQFKQLVMDPIENINPTDGDRKPSVPYVVIIDGLDECSETSVQAKIITTIAGSSSLNGTHMKFFIASRPEREIQKAFDFCQVRSMTTRLSMKDATNVDEDIETYLQDEFRKLKEVHIIAADLSKSQWPSKEDMRTLIYRSSGQFIYASTVIKYISNDDLDPREALQAIISPSMDLFSNDNPFAQLDALYLQILSEAASKSNGGFDMISSILYILLLCNDYRLERANNYTHAILDSLDNVTEFLIRSPSQVRLGMVHLCSLINMDGRIKFYHASMNDFLLDKARSGQFFIDSGKGHAYIAQRCFEIILHVGNTELFPYGDVNTFANNHSWNVSSPYWYDDDTSPLHVYALVNFFYHLIRSNMNIKLLCGFHRSTAYTVTTILAVMLLKLPGTDMETSLEPLLLFICDFWPERDLKSAHKIDEQDEDLRTCVNKILHEFFKRNTRTQKQSLNYIYVLMNYDPDEYKFLPRFPFHRLWAAAMMGNCALGGQLYLNKKEAEHLLYSSVEEERVFKSGHRLFECLTSDLNDILSPLTYYIKRFKTSKNIELFINMNISAEELDVNDKIELELKIEHIICGYICLNMGNVVYDFLKICDVMDKPCIERNIQERNVIGVDVEGINYPHGIEENSWECYCPTCDILYGKYEMRSIKPSISCDANVEMILANTSFKINGGAEAVFTIVDCLVLSNKYYYHYDRYKHYAGSDQYILSTVANMAEMIGIDAPELALQLEHLRSLIHVPTIKGLKRAKSHIDNDRIRFHEQSVENYLLEKSLSGDFSVDTVRGHTFLARRCLEIINEALNELTKSTILNYGFGPCGRRTFDNIGPSHRYALENYFYHMMGSNFNVHLVYEFCRLSDLEVQLILTAMIKQMPGGLVVKALQNLFVFDFWSENFSVPKSEWVVVVCERVNYALDCIMINDAQSKPYYYPLEWSSTLVKYDDETREEPSVNFHELWKAALMGSRTRGGDLYMEEDKYRFALLQQSEKNVNSPIHSKGYTYDWEVMNILRPLKYYLIRFNNASSVFTYFMLKKFPSFNLSFEDSQQVDLLFYKCIRAFLKDMIQGYVKHSWDMEIDSCENEEFGIFPVGDKDSELSRKRKREENEPDAEEETVPRRHEVV